MKGLGWKENFSCSDSLFSAVFGVSMLHHKANILAVNSCQLLCSELWYVLSSKILLMSEETVQFFRPL